MGWKTWLASPPPSLSQWEIKKNVLCPGEIIRESKWPPNKSLRDGMKNGVYFSIALTQHREVFNLRPVRT